MPTPVTYSFLDVQAAISGPGGSFNIGAGAAPHDEGITVAPTGDMGEMTIGADGNGMHSLKADKSGKVTARFLKNSPVNAQLSALMAAQRVSGSLYGQNTIVITNLLSGDVTTCQNVGFAKVPELKYSKVGEMLEWEFNSLQIDVALGGGL